MFFLVLAHPGSPGQRAIKRLLLLLFIGRNAKLSTIHPSSIKNLETMASDYVHTFRRQSTTVVSSLFNTLNTFVQHEF